MEWISETEALVIRHEILSIEMYILLGLSCVVFNAVHGRSYRPYYVTDSETAANTADTRTKASEKDNKASCGEKVRKVCGK